MQKTIEDIRAHGWFVVVSGDLLIGRYATPDEARVVCDDCNEYRDTDEKECVILAPTDFY